eukprot:6650581-Pyramimonas_sp.AAC.1
MSGRVASSRQGGEAAEPFAKRIRIGACRHMRNLGHDLNAARARRIVARARLWKLRRRHWRAMKLRRAAGARVAC